MVKFSQQSRRKYKALIFDLDGTAMESTPNAKPSKELANIIGRAKNSAKFCAATGRSISNAHYIFEALNLEDPCIISGGTQIVNPKTKEILWEILINFKDSEKVLDICKPYSCKVLLGNQLMNEGKEASKINFTTQTNVMYIMQIGNDDAQVVLEKLSRIKEITAIPVLSWKDDSIDIHITNRVATKKHAVKELLNMLGIKKEKVIGIGDADNDIHLFKSVGLKVAMGNATENLKSKADIITDTQEKGGLSMIIEKYFL